MIAASRPAPALRLVAGLLAAAVGGMLGFTTTEARGVLSVSALVWYAERRSP